jgi:4a-hydroxytetrahydrobiopterin dehydratase
MTDEKRKLTEAEIATELKSLPGWSVENGKLLRNYSFGSFVRAWAFMSAGALVIQQLDHHPEWFNVYDRVRVEIVTHAIQGISAADVELARKLEELAQPWLPKE